MMDGLMNGSGGNCANASKTLSIGKRKQIWINTENGCHSERKFQSGWNVIATSTW